MLPGAKIAWGIVSALAGLLLFVPALPLGLILILGGAALIAVGYNQRGQPKWQVRALVRKAHDEPQNAQALLGQALVLDPENPEALAASAESYFRAGEWGKASELYERYLAKAPDDWQAQAHLGSSYLNADAADRAIPPLQKARAAVLQGSDSHISLTNALSVAFLRKDDPGQALELLKTLPLTRHVLDDRLQESLFLRAVAHYEGRQKAAAVTDLDRLYAQNPNYPGLQEIKDKMSAGSYVIGQVQVHLAED